MLTHGALFNGIAGFPLAASWVGIPTTWTVEIDEFCNKVSKKHFPDAIQYTDIKAASNLPYVDIISGGFPCQDLSVSGKGKGITGERSGLWSEMFRIIDETRPLYVVIENSPVLLKKGFENVLYPLSEIGYDAEWQCLWASDFGLPHQRERVYVIAYSNEIRRKNPFCQNRVFKKEFHRATSTAPYTHLSKEWDDNLSEFSSFRKFDELSPELLAIASLGNAVIPIIAQYLFECIIQHYRQGA